jgi:hypothetical protein
MKKPQKLGNRSLKKIKFNANNQLSSTGQSTLHGNNIHVRGHGVGSNQFLSVNIDVIRLLSVITITTPFGNYGTSETFD